jgi:hypothetical protein
MVKDKMEQEISNIEIFKKDFLSSYYFDTNFLEFSFNKKKLFIVSDEYSRDSCELFSYFVRINFGIPCFCIDLEQKSFENFDNDATYFIVSYNGNEQSIIDLTSKLKISKKDFIVFSAYGNLRDYSINQKLKNVKMFYSNEKFMHFYIILLSLIRVCEDLKIIPSQKEDIESFLKVSSFLYDSSYVSEIFCNLSDCRGIVVFSKVLEATKSKWINNFRFRKRINMSFFSIKQMNEFISLFQKDDDFLINNYVIFLTEQKDIESNNKLNDIKKIVRSKTNLKEIHLKDKSELVKNLTSLLISDLLVSKF